jgi:hypothetical protein
VGLYFIAFLVCLAASAGTRPLVGQTVPPAPIPLGGDTSAWRPLLQHLVQTLAPYIGRAATDTVAQPWTIAFPDTTGRWKHIVAHFNTILRARKPTSSDSAYFELRVSPLRLSGDTAFAQFHYGLRKRCANGQFKGGYGNYAEPFVVRIVPNGFPMWTAAREPRVMHGDSSCW